VASLAGVSAQQAAQVIARLVKLGVVERREVPPAALVRLSADNLAARLVSDLANLRATAIDRLVESARAISPQPQILLIFGSFARGEADESSDVDVLAVRHADTLPGDDTWTRTLGEWADSAMSLLGNPVNVVEVGADQAAQMLAQGGPPVWAEAALNGILLAGRPFTELPVDQ
jgi:predicted nucleotidyltransferase